MNLSAIVDAYADAGAAYASVLDAIADGDGDHREDFRLLDSSRVSG
jgi:hypothetical protein